MKFFIGKYALFIIVLMAAVLTHWLGRSAHLHDDSTCLVLGPSVMAPAPLLSGIVMLALC